MADHAENEIRRRLLERISSLSSSYAPEWRFNREQPDLGSALAILFADMMADAAAARERGMEHYRVLFFECLGARQKAAGTAKGYLTFDLEREDLPEAVVPAGSLVSGEGDGGGQVTFRTLEDVYVSAAAAAPIKALNGMWLLRFTRQPGQGLLSLLFLVKGSADTGGPALEWSYYGAGGWSPIQVQDETGCFCHTGLVRFAGSADFKELELEGETGWWLRIRRLEADGKKGTGSNREMPPLPDGVYLNAGRAAAVMPGRESNLSAGAELELGLTVGFVSKITNPDLFFGGCGEESVESCLRRCSGLLRHGGRAVSPGDLERIAGEASDGIERVQCFGGFRGDGTRHPGAVALVVLQRDYREGGRYFYKLRERIWECLENRLSLVLAAGKGLTVTAPWFVRIDVSAKLYAGEHNLVIPLKREAGERLEQYLDPITGGCDGHGWEFGSLPDYDQISHLLERLDGVRYVREVCLTVWMDRGGGMEEAEWETVSKLPWVLPVSGTHQVEIGVAL